MSDFFLKRNDLLPVLAATLEDADGAIDLAGATVKLLMRDRALGTVKVNAAATVVQVGDGTDGSKGKVSYTWAGTNTDTAGTYDAEWQITFSTGKTLTVPNDVYDSVVIVADLA